MISPSAIVLSCLLVSHLWSSDSALIIPLFDSNIFSVIFVLIALTDLHVIAVLSQREYLCGSPSNKLRENIVIKIRLLKCIYDMEYLAL